MKTLKSALLAILFISLVFFGFCLMEIMKTPNETNPYINYPWYFYACEVCIAFFAGTIYHEFIKTLNR